MKESIKKMPSEEKIWQQFYPKGACIEDVPQCTIYQYIYDKNKAHMDQVALELWGQKITYRDLFKNADICAELFEKYGIIGENNALFCMPTIQHVSYLFLAASKKGSQLDDIAPTFSQEHLLEVMNKSYSKVLFLFEDFYDERIAESIEKSSIEKVVLISSTSLLPVGVKQMKIAKDFIDILRKKKLPIPKDNKFISWNDFMKEGEKLKIHEAIPYEKNRDLVTVYSSGTTGEPKGVVHSNEAFTAMIRQHELSGMRFIRGNLFFSAIPTWFMTGLCNCMILPLGLGVTILLDPRIENNEAIAKYFATRDIHYTIFPTTRLMAMFKSKQLKDSDFSSAIYYVAGGEPLPIGTDKWCSRFLEAHHSEMSMQKGYGRTEDGACLTVTNENFNTVDSVGIPLPWVNIKAVNIETMEEQDYNERGILFASTPCRMRKYKDNPEKTKANFIVDEKGVIWGNTGDVGFIDEKGGIHVLGRSTDYILGPKNEKIYLFDIENVLFQNEAVVQCEVVGLEIENGVREVPVAFIVLSEEYIGQEEEILFDLDKRCKEAFKNHQASVPYGFKFKTKFARAKAGKRDIAALKKERTGYAKPIDGKTYSYIALPQDGSPVLDLESMQKGVPLAETPIVEEKGKILKLAQKLIKA